MPGWSVGWRYLADRHKYSILKDFQISQTPVPAWSSLQSLTAVTVVWLQPAQNNSSSLTVKGGSVSVRNKNENQIKRFLKSDGTEVLCYKGSWINFDNVLSAEEKEGQTV